MKVPFKRILAAAAIPLLLLTGCKNSEPVSSLQPSEDSQEEESENTRVVLPDNFTLPYEPDQTLDPVTCPDGVQQTVGSLLYEGLFRLDETLTPQPCVRLTSMTLPHIPTPSPSAAVFCFLMVPHSPLLTRRPRCAGP